MNSERVSSGIETLDYLVGGGFPKNTVTLVSGGPGTGKTLFGLNFLADGASKGQNCCYLSMNEDSKGLIRACELESLNPVRERLGQNMAIEHLNMGGEIDLHYFEGLFESYPETSRLVVDNVNKLLMHADDSRQYRLVLANTVQYLRDKVDCTIIICETDERRVDTGNGEAFECDAVIHLSFLDLEARPKRALEIHKMRYSRFDPKVLHEFEISDSGLHVTEAKII